MLVVHFKAQSQPDKSEQVLAALGDVVAPSRALPGTISFDIGRDVTDPDVSISTEVYEDQAAVERQEALPEVARGHLHEALRTRSGHAASNVAFEHATDFLRAERASRSGTRGRPWTRSKRD